jgi:hypothetical protein
MDQSIENNFLFKNILFYIEQVGVKEAHMSVEHGESVRFRHLLLIYRIFAILSSIANYIK